MTTIDYEEVYQLWLDTPGMGLRSLDDSPQGIARFLKRNPHSCFVAEAGNELAGVILSGHDGRRGYIYHLAVRPEYRHQGLGRSLVEHALDALRKEHINRVALVVYEDNVPGNKFWESLGFTTRPDLVYRNISINEKNI
jgi:ribosomal protein S18 acetylase RimI-like enzyme